MGGGKRKFSVGGGPQRFSLFSTEAGEIKPPAKDGWDYFAFDIKEIKKVIFTGGKESRGGGK